MDVIEAKFKRAQTWSADAAKALASGDKERALSSLTSSTRSTKGLLLALLLEQATLSNGLGRPDETRASAVQAAALDPSCARAHYWLGRALLKEDNPVAAEGAFHRAVQAEGDGKEAKEYLELEEKSRKRAGKGKGGTGCSAGSSGQDDGITSVDVSGGGRPVVTVPGEGMTNREKADDKPYLPVPAPKPAAPRMEWYQSPALVTVDVYAKGVDAEASVVEISETKLVVKLVRPGADGFVMERELLGRVVVSESSWNATKFKVEIVLKKENASEWRTLGKEGADLSAAERARVVGEERVAKMGHGTEKDWDGIAAKELKGEKDNDGPMALFQTIYKDSDDDTKRAMMKSYQESNGKVLSTDWKDVGSRKVEFKEKETD